MGRVGRSPCTPTWLPTAIFTLLSTCCQATKPKHAAGGAERWEGGARKTNESGLLSPPRKLCHHKERESDLEEGTRERVGWLGLSKATAEGSRRSRRRLEGYTLEGRRPGAVARIEEVMNPGASRLSHSPRSQIRGWGCRWSRGGRHCRGISAQAPQTRVPSPGQETFLFLRASRYPEASSQGWGKGTGQGRCPEPPLAAGSAESGVEE